MRARREAPPLRLSLTASEHPQRWKFDYVVYHPETRADWRTWLAANHEICRGMWLCSWKKKTGRPAVPYAETVLEALCFGWIDSTVNTLDDERDLQLMTPRNARSSWSRLNRRRVGELEAAGLMTDAGRRAVKIARDNGWWTISEPVEDLIEPDELAAALDARLVARQHWDAFPPTAKKAMLWWFYSAVKPETRARRVTAIVDKAEIGQRAQG